MSTVLILRAAALSGALAACAAPAVVPDRAIPGAASVPRLGGLSPSVTTLSPSPYGGQDQFVSAAAPANRPGRIESNPTGEELAFVTGLLTRMQLQSYASGTETCGYVGRDGAGRMMATAINIGDEASCYLPQIPGGMQVLASVHTHGTYSPVYASEFPTVQDMQTDAQDGIDGYISTPGGRLWHVDSDTMTVRQLCGRGCLPQDPHYRPEDDGPVMAAYTLRELQAWEAY